jgi:hypothetical protein
MNVTAGDSHCDQQIKRNHLIFQFPKTHHIVILEQFFDKCLQNTNLKLQHWIFEFLKTSVLMLLTSDKEHFCIYISPCVFRLLVCVGFLASDLSSNLDLTEFNNIDFWHCRLKIS